MQCGCFYSRGRLRARYHPCDDAMLSYVLVHKRRIFIRWCKTLRHRGRLVCQHIQPRMAESHERYHSCGRESHMSFSSVYIGALSMPLSSLTFCTAVTTCLPLAYSRPHAQATHLSSNRAAANMSARGRGQPAVCKRLWPDPPGTLTKLHRITIITSEREHLPQGDV